MMQIIHDIAPGAALSFHTARGGQASFVQGVRDLADAGADIIVDDVLYLGETMFQDGIMAQVIDSVKSEGIAYFSAAGNLADQSYSSDFRLEETAHDFDPGADVDTLQSISVPKNTTAVMIVQWSDPFFSAGGAGADTDLDIHAIDVAGDSVAASSTDPNIGGDAVEILDVENTTGSAKEFQLRIELADGPAPDRVKYVYTPDNVSYVSGDDYGDANKPTLYGHANANGALAVGAAFYNKTPEFGTSPPEKQSFSAKGGTPILFDTDGTRLAQTDSRQKPEVVAPDGGNSTFFGDDTGADSDSHPNFFGTSAAAPHAAAVAALMWENRPGLTVDDVYDELKSTAIDMADPDFTGSGLIQADQAALPVELVAFEAVTDGRDVLLTWQTATETNNAGFRVEKRRGRGTFERVAFVPGAGTTTEAQTYQHRLADLTPGTYAFRLQQVDTDGTVHPSPVVEATIALEDAYQLSTAYPNPVQTAATLELLVREPQTVRAVVYDAVGRQVQVLHDGPVAASEPVSLTVGADKLPSGLYLIHIRGEAFSATRRATVVR